MEPCINCNANDFVTKYSKGTIVCRKCGVVAAHNIIDDRDYGFSDYNEYLENKEYDQEITYICDTLCLPEYFKEVCDTKFINLKTSHCFKAQNILICKAVVVYIVCTENRISRSPDDFWRLIGIPQAKFNIILKELNDTKEVVVVSPPESSIRTRMYGMASSIISDKIIRNRVLNKCDEYERDLRKNNEYMNKRTHKIDPILFFYVCTLENVQISRAKLMEDANISSSTFSKHLKMIKDII